MGEEDGATQWFALGELGIRRCSFSVPTIGVFSGMLFIVFSGFFVPDFSSLFWFFFGLFLAGGLGMGEVFDPPMRLDAV